MPSAHRDATRLLLSETAVLLSLPAICVQLQRVLDDPGHSRRDVAEVLRCDPALTARVLRIVNSACYSLPRKVSSISQALGLLGEQELKNLVLATSLMRLSRELGPRFDLERFWQSSLYCAIVARRLCDPAQAETREDSFIAGLLLNIGKLPLYCKEPSLLAAVNECLLQGQSEPAAERSLTGTDHAQVGALLAEAWQLPLQLRDLIAGHHATSDAYSSVAQCRLRLAAEVGDWYERHHGQPPAADNPALQGLLAALGLSVESFGELLQQSHAEHLGLHELFCGEQH